MNKRVKIIPIVLLIVLALTNISMAAEPIKVYINNNRLYMPNDPVIQESKTLVPVRAIFESMGATVEWDGTTRTVTGKTADTIIKLVIDNNIALINNKEVKLDVQATIINGSTMVPARFVAESLGAKVDWDNNTRSVLVNSEYPYGKHKVVRVVDGDTFIVGFNEKEERVRLIGVDTPESVHPDTSRNVGEGKSASEYTKSMLEGKEVALEFDVQERDHYGRLLAYVWIDGKMYNKTLLEEGYAKVATYPPNVKYVSEFTELESLSRISSKGLWAYEESKKTDKLKEEIEQERSQTINLLNVKAGEDATLAMKVTPNTEYKISVYYSSGVSTAKGLEPKKSDANGNVSWTWEIGSRTKSGTYRIVVTGDKTTEFQLVVN